MDLQSARKEILKQLVETGRPEPMLNVISILDSKLDYESAFELVMDMQNADLIKLVYCTFPNVINVQLTLVGEKEHELSRP